MNSIFEPPNSNLEIDDIDTKITRPRSVTVIAFIFIAIAFIDFIFSVRLGLVYKTHTYDASGAIISTGYKAEILWLLFYGIGAGLMRGGKFARAMACLFGILALILPGLLLIYYLYNTKAKDFFNIKRCDSCGDTSYINKGFVFKGISCKKCSKSLKFESA